MSHSLRMTSTAPTTELDPASSGEQPYRHGMPWTEEDFAGIMQASREGCGLEEIAVRIGRSVHALRPQLRRLLPADERHLAADLVLPRLRQLERDGDYDWLAAMAQPTRSPWELRFEAEAARDEWGIGALSDDELVALASTVAGAAAQLPAALRRAIAGAVHGRGLEHVVRRCALGAVDEAVDALLDRDGAPWSYDDRSPF